MINSDDLEKNGVRWSMVDELRDNLYDREPLCMNTDVKGEGTQGGIHWITVYPRGDTIYIIDSLGKDNYRLYDNLMFSQMVGMKVRFFNGKFQYDDDVLCGFFTIYICKMLQNNPECDVFEEVEKVFGLSADDGDIRKLIDAFGMYRNGKIDKLFDE